MEKKLHKHPEKLTSKIMELNTKNGWKDTTNKIKENIKRNTQEINTGEINSSQLNNFFKKKIENTCEGKTKTQYLLERPKYMKELTRQEASIIFKARTRMLDVKNNFRGKYNDTKCRKCPENKETQEHVLETCPGIHTDPSTKITKSEIFENDTKKLKNTSTKITKILKEIQI